MTEVNIQVSSMSSGWIIKRPIFISFSDHEITYKEGKKIFYSIKLNDIAVITLDATSSKRVRLVLTEISGRKTIIVESINAANDGALTNLITLLVNNMPKFNQFALFEIVSPVIGWVGAWVFLLVSLGVIIGSLWVALVTQYLPTVLLPLTIVPITLAIVTPILLAGRRQKVEPQLILATVRDRKLN